MSFGVQSYTCLSKIKFYIVFFEPFNIFYIFDN